MKNSTNCENMGNGSNIKKMKNSKICQTKFHQNYNNLWESDTHLEKGKIFTE